MLYNTQNSYGSIAKLFHWAVAIIILLMLIVGFTFALTEGHQSFRITLITLHKSLGITLLIIMICRLLWRFLNRKPALPFNMVAWEKGLTHLVEFLLYFSVFAMIIVGWVMSSASGHSTQFWGLMDISLPIAENPSLAQLTQNLHLILAWTIIVLVLIHVAGACKHHFINKDNVLRRMLPFRRIY